MFKSIFDDVDETHSLCLVLVDRNGRRDRGASSPLGHATGGDHAADNRCWFKGLQPDAAGPTGRDWARGRYNGAKPGAAGRQIGPTYV